MKIESEADFLVWLNSARILAREKLAADGISWEDAQCELTHIKSKNCLPCIGTTVSGGGLSKPILITENVFAAFHMLDLADLIEDGVTNIDSMPRYRLVLDAMLLADQYRQLHEKTWRIQDFKQEQSARAKKQAGVDKSVTTRALRAVLDADGESMAFEEIMNLLPMVRGNSRYRLETARNGKVKVVDTTTHEEKEVAPSSLRKALERLRK